MRLILTVFLLVAAYRSILAQPNATPTPRPAPGQSISGQVGLLGPALFYNRELSHSHRLTGRIGGRYIAYRNLIRIKTAPESYLTIAPDFVIGIAQADLKWRPFHRSSLFVTAGVGYTWHPGIGFVITTDNKLNLGGLELAPEDVGTIRLGVRWHPVVGYAGWGFGRAIPRRRIGVGFEMGVYYLGRPTVQLDYEGFLETTNLSEQVPVVERNLSNYRYLPSLSLTVSYLLNRSSHYW